MAVFTAKIRGVIWWPGRLGAGGSLEIGKGTLILVVASDLHEEAPVCG